MTKKQKELYNHPLWQKKRLEIMQRDNFTYVNCGETEKTLNVHHKSYIWGNKPWDYEDDNFITLCKSRHKKEHEEEKRVKDDSEKEKKKEKPYIKYHHMNQIFFHPTIVGLINGFKGEEYIEIKKDFVLFMYELERFRTAETNMFIWDVIRDITYFKEGSMPIFIDILEKAKIIIFNKDPRLMFEINMYSNISEGKLKNIVESYGDYFESDTILITDDFIDRGMSCNGGWKNKQIELLGVTTKKGWRIRAIGTTITKENADKFIAIRKAK